MHWTLGNSAGQFGPLIKMPQLQIWMSDFYVHVIPIGAKPPSPPLSPDSGVYLIRASNEWTFARFVSLAGVHMDL